MKQHSEMNWNSILKHLSYVLLLDHSNFQILSPSFLSLNFIKRGKWPLCAGLISMHKCVTFLFFQTGKSFYQQNCLFEISNELLKFSFPLNPNGTECPTHFKLKKKKKSTAKYLMFETLSSFQPTRHYSFSRKFDVNFTRDYHI